MKSLTGITSDLWSAITQIFFRSLIYAIYVIPVIFTLENSESTDYHYDSL